MICEDQNDYKHIHLAIAAIEGTAKRMNITSAEAYQRLNHQGLISNFLLKYYDELHTQSLEWLGATTVETLKNWEAGN